MDGTPEWSLWDETCSCLGVQAWTAAVMLCRKMLFHLAVLQGLAEKDADGRAPSFYACVKHLEDSGLISASMRGWVDRIKDVGNGANHEIPGTTEKEAMDIASFTQQLLVLMFEIPAVMASSDPASGG